MEGAPSPYAPGIVSDERSPPRPPGRPALFLIASFLMALVGPGLLWLQWTQLLVVADIAAEGSWPFHTLAIAPAALSLLWGLLSDRWPILDTRREGHLLFAALLMAGAWLALQFLETDAPRVLAGCAIIAAGAIASVAIGGALVEISRRLRTTGRLAAAWIGALVAAELAEIPFSELVGVRPEPLKIGLCTGLAAAVAILMAVSRATDRAPAPPAVVHPPLRVYLGARALWAPAAVLALAALGHVPDSAIAGGEWPWHLRAATVGGQLAGALVYAFACRRMPLARSAGVALMLSVLVAIAFGGAAVQTGEGLPVAPVVLGLVEGFRFAALTDLVLRASPPGHEAFVCAMLSAVDRGGWEAQRLLADALGLSVPGTLTIAAAASLAALLASRLLPASLVAWREGDAPPS
jgi:hypothetical protein